MPTFTFTVDGEPLQTDAHQLTADQILEKAKLDPATHYLIEVNGQNKESFQGRGGFEIRMHEKMTFISIFTGPMPVS